MTDKPTPTFVQTGPGGTSFVGPDAVDLYRAITLKVALGFYVKTKMLMTRNATPTTLLTIATEYTGKAYKRGQHQIAHDDLVIWIETMKAAMPVIDQDGEQ